MLLRVIVRYLRISIVLSKVGMETGQLTWQERQAVHDQSVSSWMTASSSPSSFLPPPAARSHSPLRSWISFLGDKGFWLRCAGHLSWHLPQRVHASRSNICL